ncbi:MAG: hypothetical protein MUE41_09680 [Gemmatimonadaceae bacterium]|jgi:hypothetical protein|nr:hypothetical protein [Gemmatimonadaceae bacterium]
MPRRLSCLLPLVALLASACGGDGDGGTAPATSRTARYEISGTYSGHLTVVYATASGANQATTVTSLPWSADVTFAPGVAGAGIGAQSVPTQLGRPGQTATVRIVVGGTAVQSTSGTTDASGSVVLPTIAYVLR